LKNRLSNRRYFNSGIPEPSKKEVEALTKVEERMIERNQNQLQEKLQNEILYRKSQLQTLAPEDRNMINKVWKYSNM